MTQPGQPRTAVVLGPGEGLDVSRRNGRDSVLKVTGKDTAGHLAIGEIAHPPGVPGPPRTGTSGRSRRVAVADAAPGRADFPPGGLTA